VKAARLIALVCAAFVICPTRVRADAPGEEEDALNPDRPGIADGSSVVGRRRFQVETALQLEWRDQERSLLFPTLLRLGIGERLEARVEGNTYTRVQIAQAGSAAAVSDGLAPLSLGLKAHFQDSHGAHRPSLGAILRVFPPSGSSDFHTHHATGDLRLAADWDFAPRWSLNPNLGAAVVEDESGKVFSALLSALTLTFAPKSRVGFFVDGALQSPEQLRGRSVVIFDAGATLVLGHDVQLDVSAGAGAAGATPPHPFLAAGFSRRF
jgi:hypothetical protein